MSEGVSVSSTWFSAVTSFRRKVKYVYAYNEVDRWRGAREGLIKYCVTAYCSLLQREPARRWLEVRPRPPVIIIQSRVTDCAFGMRKGNSDWPKLVETRKYSFPTFSDVWLFQGIARTQSPIQKNYALESPAFEVIAAVNLTKVQWKGLTPDRLRSWSKFSPCQVSMLNKDPKNIYTQPSQTMNTLSCWHEIVAWKIAVYTVFVNIIYFC